MAGARAPGEALGARPQPGAGALVGGEDGLAIVRRIVEESGARLERDGVLAMEVGAGQAPAVESLFERAGFEAVERRRDYAGHERIVSGRRGQGPA